MSAENKIQLALESVYMSLQNDNENIDSCIAQLKEALEQNGQDHALIDTTRLAQNNRQGRKLMESYFRKRGVTVKFS